MSRSSKKQAREGKLVKTVRPRHGHKVVFRPRMSEMTEYEAATAVLATIQEHGLNLPDFSVSLSGVAVQYTSADAQGFEGCEEPGVEYQMASKFITNLHLLSQLDPQRPILIHMKTGGGKWAEGMAIYNSIMACPNPVTILAHTPAESISAVILQAADKRVLMPQVDFLIHGVKMSISGTAKEVRAFAAASAEKDKVMLNILSRSLKDRGKFQALTQEQIEKMLQEEMDSKGDFYLSAQEAVEWGFADEVFGANGVYDWNSLRKF